MADVLVVSVCKPLRDAIANIVRVRGHNAAGADLPEADGASCDVLVVDLDGVAPDRLRGLLAPEPASRVVLLSSHATAETAASFVSERRAWQVVAKPVSPFALERVLASAAASPAPERPL